MKIRHASLFLITAAALIIGNGCQKSDLTNSSPPLPLSKDTIMRVHWIGKAHLSVDGSAFFFMRIWQLPASQDLEKQTLNKLSVVPSSFLAFPTGRRPAQEDQLAASLLRPLLNEALQRECYLEIRQSPTNPYPETLFAIRLNDALDGSFETNLAIAAQSLTGFPALTDSNGRRGWVVRKNEAPNVIQVRRSGDWTFVGLAQGENTLLEQTLPRAAMLRDPFRFHPATNYWLEADVDPRRLAKAFSLNWNLPTNSPLMSVTVTGDGGDVITHGELNFPLPLDIRGLPSSWTIPTNLIREPLTSFTAVRGIESAATSKLWTDFSAFLGNTNPPPDQLFLWSQAGLPFQTYFAAQVPGASHFVQQLSDRLMTKGNSWLSAHNYVSFQPTPDSNGVEWGNLSFSRPFLTSSQSGDTSFVFGGLLPSPNPATNPPINSALLQNLATTNLLFFDWEITGQRIDPWLDISQTARSLLQLPQFPINSVAGTWLGTIRPRLGESTSEIVQTGPNQLAFTRKSTVGFTAPELHLLVDWLESPRFPLGLYSLSAAPASGSAPPTR